MVRLIVPFRRHGYVAWSARCSPSEVFLLAIAGSSGVGWMFPVSIAGDVTVCSPDVADQPT